ncbi:ATP-binding protein [Puia sp.]|uniref:ATP-binding protein n=1 Tax=Puia sp. TaxID=2045100 RepID=UPI002F41937E
MTIPKELQVLDKLIRSRVTAEAEGEQGGAAAADPKMPAYDKWELPLGGFAKEQKLKEEEALLLLIGLAHHIQPDLFQTAIESVLKNGGEFPKIGGVTGKNFRGFLPTGDTALFLLSGGDWKKRLEVQRLFSADHFFAVRKIVWLEEVPQGEPAMSGKIIVSQEYIELLTRGEAAPPHFGMSFPAKRVTTDLDWDHLVVNDNLRKQIGDLLDWRQYHDGLREKDIKQGRFRNGYRTLFYGPPGTGKTFTAALLGKAMQKDVYRIDLSMVVSKYIGETEKNLEMLFARAEDKDWILFFDEADAIFGKRTNVRDAHDKYANQEVSYLLQRIEDYNGLVILASNMRNNIDEAFIRRFNSILHFPMPDAEERKLIWQKTFLPGTKFRAEPGDVEADIIEQVKHYQLSGGSILNIVHYASIKGAKRMEEGRKKKTDGLTIYLPDLIQGVRLEFSKDNIPFK